MKEIIEMYYLTRQATLKRKRGYLSLSPNDETKIDRDIHVILRSHARNAEGYNDDRLIANRIHEADANNNAMEVESKIGNEFDLQMKGKRAAKIKTKLRLSWPIEVPMVRNHLYWHKKLKSPCLVVSIIRPMRASKLNTKTEPEPGFLHDCDILIHLIESDKCPLMTAHPWDVIPFDDKMARHQSDDFSLQFTLALSYFYEWDNQSREWSSCKWYHYPDNVYRIIGTLGKHFLIYCYCIIKSFLCNDSLINELLVKHTIVAIAIVGVILYDLYDPLPIHDLII
jgi:hypothetical protein